MPDFALNERREIRYLLLAWLSFFVVTAGVAFFAAELPGGLTLSSPAADIQKWAGEGGDATSYLKYAEGLLENGGFKTWHPCCFPPGMAVLYAGILKLFGPENFLFWSQWTSVFLWSIALTFILLAMGNRLSVLSRFALVSSLWLFPTMRDWAFGMGALYSESKSHPLFLVSFCLLIMGLRSQRRNYLYWGFVVLAVNAYLRTYFEKMGIFFAVGLWGAALVGIYQHRKTMERVARRTSLVLPALLLATFLLVLAPWSYRNLKSPLRQYGMAPAQMHITFYHLWETTEATPAILGEGGNTACVVRPDSCKRLHQEYGRVIPDPVAKKSALAAFLGNPFLWYQYRMTRFHEFWMGVPHQLRSWDDLGVFLEGIFSYIFTAFLLLLAITQLFSQDYFSRNLAWLVCAFYGFNFVVFTFAGMGVDGRHAVPIRLFSILGFLWVLAVVNVPIRNYASLRRAKLTNSS